MKKIIIAMCVVFVLMISVGFVIAGKNQQLTDEENPDNSRYLVKSNNGILKAMYGVNHNFNSGFTTDLTPGQLKILEKFGVEVEEVPIYTILARPTCGDGVCHPSEPLKCPQDCGVSPEPEPEPEPVECLPDEQTPWGIAKVNGGSGGEGIIVAVLDTGIDTNHPDLVENIIKCVSFGYRTCEDDNGHGTHVAGTIAANGNIIGVAPETNLMAIKVLDKKGRGYTDDIAKGIEYAADNNANIISMSLGGPTQSGLIRDAIDYAVSKGVLVIASAGNSGPDDGSIGYPAANVKVIAIGAIYESEAVPDFSSRGIYVDPADEISEREIEFAAPGVYVESTWNNGCYNTISGTSMAAPHVAGLAAKLWYVDADITRTKLQELAKLHDLHTKGYDTATGFGLPIAITI